MPIARCTAEAAELDPRDRALAMRLAYGAVQRAGTLDHLIERLPSARRPARPAAARGAAARALRAAVPARRARLRRRRRRRRARQGARPRRPRLVNAVLRRAAREGPTRCSARSTTTRPRAPPSSTRTRCGSRGCGGQALGPERRARADGRRQRARRGRAARQHARHRRRRARRPAAGAQRTATPRIPEALVLEEPFDVHGSPLWRAGALIAQSRAAMLVARALDPPPGERVLDLCAAPGRQEHPSRGADGRPRRGRRGRAQPAPGARPGAHRAAAARRDRAGRGRRRGARARSERCFDRVLVDPPCSGLGTLQARPDLRWRATPAAMRELARPQAQILAAGAARSVREACSSTLRARSPRPRTSSRSRPSSTPTPSSQLDDLPARLARSRPSGARQSLQTLPHRDRTAGFFIARLRRG